MVAGIDCKLTFREEIRRVCGKSVKITSYLRGSMTNFRWSFTSNRRLVKCLSPIPYSCMDARSGLMLFIRTSIESRWLRFKASRITSSYPTVSESLVLVVVGVISIDLLAWEMKIVHKRRDVIGRRTTKEEAGALAIRQLHEHCKSETRGRWTVRLITNIAEWIGQNHGEVN